MGAWGTAIFSDDTAMDVRAGYREQLEDGHTGAEATQLLLDEFGDLAEDPDDDPVFWLALAATQWKLGRLEDEVKAKALDIIENGRGLDVWEDEGPALLQKRKEVLEKLREQLNTPQPAEKKVRKPWTYQTDLEVGDAISYRLDSGDYVILRVVIVESSRYGDDPVFELCDWIGPVVPSAAEISRLPYIIEENDIADDDRHAISPHKKSAYPTDRIKVVAKGLPVRQVDKPRSFASWIWADIWLNRIAVRLNRGQRRLKRSPFRMLKKLPK